MILLCGDQRDSQIYQLSQLRVTGFTAFVGFKTILKILNEEM